MGSWLSTAAAACGDFCSLLSFGGPGGGHPSKVVIKGAAYRVDRIIGEGSYSYVYLATDRIGGATVALKRFAVQEQEAHARLMEEVRIHRSLCPHDNIVLLIESDTLVIKGKPLPEVWMVMELVQGPSLQNLVNTRKLASSHLCAKEVIGIVGDVVQALGHMHSQSPPIAHWDIKLDNVLQQGDRCKLCDFGSASTLFYQCSTAQHITIAEAELGARMTLFYRPPESLDLWRKQRVDTKADVWSLGVLVFVLLMQEMPFDENPLDVLIGRPKHFRGKSDDCFAVGNNANMLPPELQPLMHLVMTQMLIPDPANRKDIFSVGEALQAMEPAFSPPARPRPGFISAQKNRFDAR